MPPPSDVPSPHSERRFESVPATVSRSPSAFSMFDERVGVSLSAISPPERADCIPHTGRRLLPTAYCQQLTAHRLLLPTPVIQSCSMGSAAIELRGVHFARGAAG